jgi:hypothetical protein
MMQSTPGMQRTGNDNLARSFGIDPTTWCNALKSVSDFFDLCDQYSATRLSCQCPVGVAWDDDGSRVILVSHLQTAHPNGTLGDSEALFGGVRVRVEWGLDDLSSSSSMHN